MINHLHRIKVLIEEGAMDDVVPHDCPVCQLVFRDIDDVMSYENWECCTDCRDQFVYQDKEAWLSGKRPTEEQIEKFRESLRLRPTYLV